MKVYESKLEVRLVTNQIKSQSNSASLKDHKVTLANRTE